MFECKPMGDTQGTFLDLDKWVVFGCQNRVSYFTSSSTYDWINEKGIKVKVYSVGEAGGDVSVFRQILGSNFHRYHMTELSDSVSLKNINALLNRRNRKSDVVYSRLILLRALTNSGFSYDAFIMIENDHPDWVVLCKNYCNNSEPEYFKVVQKHAVR